MVADGVCSFGEVSGSRRGVCGVYASIAEEFEDVDWGVEVVVVDPEERLFGVCRMLLVASR